MNQTFQDVSTKANNKSTRAARPFRQIPTELDLNNIYYPKYHITELISTKAQQSVDTHIRRPPNGFFLMKNCYMLELRKLGYRYTMPEICRHSKKIWSELPQHAKKTYERLSIQSQCVHNEKYPNYKFEPKKKRNNSFKSYTPKTEDPMQKSFSAFSTTNILGTSNNLSEKDSCSSNFLLSTESSESESFSTSNFPSDKDSFSSNSLLSESEIFDDSNLLSDNDSNLSNSLLSESKIFGACNLLSDKDSILSNFLLSESEISSVSSGSSPTNSLEITAFQMNSSLGEFSLESFPSSESISLESQLELNNEFGIFEPFLENSEGIQTLPLSIPWNFLSYLNIPNNNDCYVYNCFPFISDDNDLQQDFVGSETLSNYVSSI
ncbi:17232_t:CDS:2 [Dentiscutata heterogama]|uniref:17232_t:CDS:1 n=1 Tax=Dentiscutata heterogama TaxID=1316150 RepID=A0ACA9MEZ4_9GLOM|nr:17232_t:CDS:2 [Dentiscutata heterogama]